MNIPIARTSLTDMEINSVLEPLSSGWIVQGPKVKEFEDKWSNFTKAKHSIAVTSCTTGLHLSLVALGIKPEDEIIVPAFTWIATANVVEHLNAKVVFCDIDLKTFNINIESLKSKITKKTKAIIPVHLFGLSADMNPILELAKRNNIRIVEDAACGFGAKYNDAHVGTLGDTGCFSFHPRKAITTGEGGMITTNNDDLAEKIRSLRDHGATVSDFQRHHGSRPYLLSEHSYAGYNYRMTDIQAALGLSQMKRAEQVCDERRMIGNKYNKRLENINFFQLPIEMKNYQHGYQSYPCLFDIHNISLKNIEKINNNRNSFMDVLQQNGISTRPATHAVHMLDYYKRKYKLKSEDFPNAYIANECSISFPLFNGLTGDEQEYVIKIIEKNL
ncbi:MAG: aminotransferase DegT [Candidatus Marinimicrobia bacterium]|nr:aminotransferase DegT [Candidatus Neomarinimicrobiota bacterium]|tara:strand:- start:692 stop:1855 length:1164 start_codon:yes stop_codon:yes gene_type:complete